MQWEETHRKMVAVELANEGVKWLKGSTSAGVIPAIPEPR